MSSDLRSARIKFILGLLILSAIGIGWVWTVQTSATIEPVAVPTASIHWHHFPVVSGEPIAASTETGAQVIFVYSTKDCKPNSTIVRDWFQFFELQPQIRTTGVFQTKNRRLARRYTRLFPTPLPTRLDSIGWFRRTFDLTMTPAVLLVSEDQRVRVLYPEAKALTHAQKLALVEAL